MGGRGTYAIGNNVPFTYKTVGFIEGIKILQGLNGHQGLPEEAHSSTAYIQLHPDGKFKMLRIYDKDHYLVKEIAYHRERRLTGHDKPVLHVHEYGKDFISRTTRLLTPEEFIQYKKYFRGIEL